MSFKSITSRTAIDIYQIYQMKFLEYQDVLIFGGFESQKSGLSQ